MFTFCPVVLPTFSSSLFMSKKNVSTVTCKAEFECSTDFVFFCILKSFPHNLLSHLHLNVTYNTNSLEEENIPGDSINEKAGSKALMFNFWLAHI